MAISDGTAGAWTATTTRNQTVTLPAHSAGQMLLVRIGWKSATPTTDVAFCNTTGWNKLGQYYDGGGASSNGGGGVLVALFWKVAESAAETDPVIEFDDATAPTPGAYCAVSYSKASTEVWANPAGDGGAVAAATSYSGTAATHVAAASGDMLDAFVVTNDNTTLTVPTVSQSGLTLDTVTEYPGTALSSTTSNDISADGCNRLATAGTSSAAAVMSGTNSVADPGAVWITRLRVLPAINPSAIASVEAFGTATLLKGSVVLAPSSIATGEAFGSATVTAGGAEPLTIAPVGIAAPSGYVGEVLADSPTFVLPMDEASGSITDIIGSLVGTASGSPVYGVSGPVAGHTGIQFPAGTDYFSITDPGTGSDLDLGDGPFTIELWFARDTDLGATVAVFFAKGVNSINSGVNADMIFLGKTGINSIANSTWTIPDTGWHHYVWTSPAPPQSAGSHKFYHDSVGPDTLSYDNYTLSGANTNDPLIIGRENSTERAAGRIAYLAFYKTELSATRIAAHYNARNSASAFGSPTLKPSATVQPSASDTAETFGTAAVSTPAGPITIAPSAIDSAEAFGTHTVSTGAGPLTISPSAIASGSAFGTTILRAIYYIAPTGSDTTGNGSIDSPWKSLSKAYAIATAGTTVYCRGGTYSGTGTNLPGTITSVGTAEAPIVVAAYPGEAPVFDGTGIDVGTQNIGFFFYNTAAYHVLRGLTVQNWALYNEVGQGAALFDTSSSTAGGVHHLTVEDCVFDFSSLSLPNNNDHVVYVGAGTDYVTVTRCLIIATGKTSSFGAGFHIYHNPGARYVDFTHNILKNCPTGIIIWVPPAEGGTDYEILHNTFIDCQADGDFRYGDSIIVRDNASNAASDTLYRGLVADTPNYSETYNFYAQTFTGYRLADSQTGITAASDGKDAGALHTIRNPSSISSAAAFGTTTVILGTAGGSTVIPSAIASAEAFGTATILRGGVAVLPTGIATAEAFGTATILRGNRNLQPTGIASAEAFGTATVLRGTALVLPSAINTAEAFGTATLLRGGVSVLPVAISSLEAFGTAVVVAGGAPPQTVTTTSIDTSEAFGTHTLLRGNVNITATGISSAEAFGTAVLRATASLLPVGIATAEAFGTATLLKGTATIIVSGIASAEAFGTLYFAAGQLLIAPTGLAPAESFGSATVLPGGRTITVTGLATAQAFGTTVLLTTRTLAVTGIASTEQFGVPVVIRGAVAIVTQGAVTAEALGTPTIIMGAGVILPSPIGSAELFGNATVTIASAPGQSVQPTALDTSETFGTAVLRAGMVRAIVAGIGTAEVVPNPTLYALREVRPTGITPAEIMGSPVLAKGSAYIRPTGLVTFEIVPTPALANLLDSWRWINRSPGFVDTTVGGFTPMQSGLVDTYREEGEG